MNEHKNIITIEDEIKEFSDKPVKSSALFKKFKEVEESGGGGAGTILSDDPITIDGHEFIPGITELYMQGDAGAYAGYVVDSLTYPALYWVKHDEETFVEYGLCASISVFSAPDKNPDDPQAKNGFYVEPGDTVLGTESGYYIIAKDSLKYGPIFYILD